MFKRCKFKEKISIADGITTDKQCVYVSAFKELEMPEVGSTVKLRVVNVVSINTFYACLINSQSEGMCIRIISGENCDVKISLQV